jgi:SAM-dependent methyltransferase
MPLLDLQRNQPEGVPPLPVTGERTLPDVPSENYWYRRHLIVYQWIAERVRGQRVIDMACGEGYGADLLAGAAESVIGVDANPEAFEHARLRYTRPNLTFERDMVERFAAPCDAITFLETIEHVQTPEPLLAHFAELVEPAGGAAYVSTPNRLTLAEPGAEKSINPWHVREYTAADFRALCAGAFGNVELLALRHAGRLRAHEVLVPSGWRKVHERTGAAARFYDWLGPRVRESDFALEPLAPADDDGPVARRALNFLAVCR